MGQTSAQLLPRQGTPQSRGLRSPWLGTREHLSSAGTRRRRARPSGDSVSPPTHTATVHLISPPVVTLIPMLQPWKLRAWAPLSPCAGEGGRNRGLAARLASPCAAANLSVPCPHPTGPCDLPSPAPSPRPLPCSPLRPGQALPAPGRLRGGGGGSPPVSPPHLPPSALPPLSPLAPPSPALLSPARAALSQLLHQLLI